MANLSFSNMIVKFLHHDHTMQKIKYLHLKSNCCAPMERTIPIRIDCAGTPQRPQEFCVSICNYYTKIDSIIHLSHILFETFVRFFKHENIATRVNTQTAALDGWA